MAETVKKSIRKNKDPNRGQSKSRRKPAVLAPQGLTLGDLLGKKLEYVKRESEEKQKKMVKEARNNPAVQKSSAKFAK